MELLSVREGLFVTITMGSNNAVGIAEMSALLAMLGITIYALGLVALSWPIYRRITNDASTALYAVSLMPKTVVAGQGVRILFGYPFFITAFLLSLILIEAMTLRTFEQIVGYGGWTYWGGTVIITLLMVGVFMFLWARMKTVHNAFNVSGVGRSATVLANICAGVMGLAASLIVFIVFFIDTDGILPRLPGWTTVVSTVVSIFLLNCVTAFILAMNGDPPLPEIALNGSTTAEGKLVAHVDGVWYILDDKGNLVGIPDDKADRVLVSPN